MEGRAAAQREPPKPTRQVTPSDTVGILSNGNIRLDERLDLIDFLENASDSEKVITQSATVGWGPALSVPSSRPSSLEHDQPRHRSALDIAEEAERQAALAELQDEIPAVLPWYLQTLMCLCFPAMGVETSMRTACGAMPPAVRKRVRECLAVIERVE